MREGHGHRKGGNTAGVVPQMFWYQDHEESCSCEGLPRQGENHQLLPKTSLTALKIV